MPRLTLALTAGALALIPAAASGQEPAPSTHAAPPGAAFWVSNTASVVGERQVRITLRCQEGSTPCTGTVRLVTTKPVRVRPRGPRRVVAVISGSYGEIQPGSSKRVSLVLRKAARHHILSHAATATRIKVRNDVDPSFRPFLPDRISVRR